MNCQRIKGIIIQNLFQLRHSLEDIIDVFFWPSMDVVIWGLMTTYFIRLEGTVAEIIIYLMGGLILWNIVWRAQQDISVSFLKNIWNRNLLNLFSSPLTIWEFITATMILGIFKIILTLSFVSAVAFLLYSFNIFSLGFYLLPFFVGLIIFAWTVGIIISGLIIRFGMRIQVFAWSLIILFQPLSAVFYPISILPAFLQKVAWFLPTAHIFEGMRQVLKDGTVPSEHLIWAFSLNIIYLVFSIYFFNFMFKKAKESGRLARVEI
ncbi:MAG: ABC transporter permease [Patescibacteria group bacterium]